jgi:hypothetical protein
VFVLTDVFHSVHHTVNTDYPERNGDVFIIDVPRMDGVDPDKKYCGYAIFFRMDPIWARDYKEIDWYSCKVYTPNKLLVKMPAWPYALFSNEDWKILQTYLRTKEPLLESLDNKRKGFATEQGQPKKDRMFKFILLDFGSEVKLSSKVVYSNAGEEEQCEWEFYPIPHLKNKSVSNIHANNVKVIRTREKKIGLLLLLQEATKNRFSSENSQLQRPMKAWLQSCYKGAVGIFDLSGIYLFPKIKCI